MGWGWCEGRGRVFVCVCVGGGGRLTQAVKFPKRQSTTPTTPPPPPPPRPPPPPTLLQSKCIYGLSQVPVRVRELVAAGSVDGSNHAVGFGGRGGGAALRAE